MGRAEAAGKGRWPPEGFQRGLVSGAASDLAPGARILSGAVAPNKERLGSALVFPALAVPAAGTRAGCGAVPGRGL